jgi:hypothetical protein
MILRNKIYPETMLSCSNRKESYRIERKKFCSIRVPCKRVADRRFESKSGPENESEGERKEGGRSLSRI